MVGKLSIGDQIRETQKKLEALLIIKLINSIDEGYDAEDAIYNDYIYKNNTPQFNLVMRSQDGNSCDFKHEFIEYRGYNSFIPTKEFCSFKRSNYLTNSDNRNNI